MEREIRSLLLQFPEWAIPLVFFALAGLLLWLGRDDFMAFINELFPPKAPEPKKSKKKGSKPDLGWDADEERDRIAGQPRIGTRRTDDSLGTYARGSGPRPIQDDPPSPNRFGGGSAEASRPRQSDAIGRGEAGEPNRASPWRRPASQGPASVGWPPPQPRNEPAELPGAGVDRGASAGERRDHAAAVVAAWREAWASDIVSVRSLVERMGQVSGVRGVNVLPESSVVVVQFDGAFLAVPSQQDYELCEKLFEADRPPGRFATVIDLERAAVVSGTGGEVVQRGLLRIECG